MQIGSTRNSEVFNGYHPDDVAGRFPSLQNFEATSYSLAEDYRVVTGTVEVPFTEAAWTESGYRDGHFYRFNEWLQALAELVSTCLFLEKL